MVADFWRSVEGGPRWGQNLWLVRLGLQLALDIRGRTISVRRLLRELHRHAEVSRLAVLARLHAAIDALGRAVALEFGHQGVQPVQPKAEERAVTVGHALGGPVAVWAQACASASSSAFVASVCPSWT